MVTEPSTAGQQGVARAVRLRRSDLPAPRTGQDLPDALRVRFSELTRFGGTRSESLRTFPFGEPM